MQCLYDDSIDYLLIICYNFLFLNLESVLIPLFSNVYQYHRIGAFVFLENDTTSNLRQE